MPEKTADVGAMRHRITLQSVVIADQAPSPAGVPPQTSAETWESKGTFWASIEPQRIRRTIGVDTPRSSLWSRVLMRNPGVPITSKDRFLFGSRTLVIDAVQRVDERNAYLEIEVTENVA